MREQPEPNIVIVSHIVTQALGWTDPVELTPGMLGTVAGHGIVFIAELGVPARVSPRHYSYDLDRRDAGMFTFQRRLVDH